MRDEYDDRLYQAFRQDFAENIAAIARSVAHAFDRLHARIYDAPWSPRKSGTEKARASKLTTL